MNLNNNIVETKEVIKKEIVNQLDNIKNMLIDKNEEFCTGINYKIFFYNWISIQKKEDGNLYSDRTKANYIRVLEKELALKCNIDVEGGNIFNVCSRKEIENIIDVLNKDNTFNEYNESNNRTPKSALLAYNKFLLETTLICRKNCIVFGAPGTGKSYFVEKSRKSFFDRNFKRVTFHPNYTYSQFVGSYKPISKNVLDGECNKEIISYDFVAGPFLNVLIEALKNEKNGIPYLLVIEEINRANPAGVFGDIFQLLDRNSDGKSTYKISMSNEMKKYVCKELKRNIEELYIPSNMYIWATMNSADQGVYPMDSAFKRRWSFEYIGIDKNEEKLQGEEYELIRLKDKNNTYSVYEWNKVRKTINEKLKVDGKINEDKLLGPFFLSKTELLKSKENQEEFDEIFKSKVLMYLYEDILKHKKIDFFIEGVQKLSDIMNAYDNGRVFNFEIEKRETEGDNYNLKIAEEQSSYETKE
ncbi:AAA family ATPase [Clostridium perfringens]|uniref:AAA family ATPase n=1 Tax=Clostridium perfringens TaxID=1502 RepID=UPI0024BC9D23|nr:AAA family ATPase [Clostridium perfringens]